MGVPADDGTLAYVGNVGTGFSDSMLRSLTATLEEIATPESPFGAVLPKADARDAHWVMPTLVGEVTFGEWTRDGRLRHPSWRGLRPDKQAGEVRRES
jgi:bifunctional non-homologous end joining protein LigD